MPIIKNTFSLNDEDLDKIQSQIRKMGSDSEIVINDYLHQPAAKQLIDVITNELPVSKKGKRHAKTHKWYSQDNYNLSVAISNDLKGKRGTSYYYLYYVVTGTGTSKDKSPNDFLARGTNKSYQGVVTGLIEQLENFYKGGFK